MKTEKLKGQVSWIQHTDVQAHLTSSDIQHPWFPAYKEIKAADQRTTWFSALVPVPLIPDLIKNESWDLTLGGGHPSVWTHYDAGKAEVAPVFWTGREAKSVVERPSQKPGETDEPKAKDPFGDVQSTGGGRGDQGDPDAE